MSSVLFTDRNLKLLNLINEIINTVARDKSDMQYIGVDGSTGKNLGFLIIDELTRKDSLHVSITQ